MPSTRLGYLPIFADAHNQHERFERYLEMLLQRHVDGLIVVANWLFVDIHILADLNKAEVPTVTLGWEIPGNRVSFAMVDNEAGGAPLAGTSLPVGAPAHRLHSRAKEPD